MKYLHWEVQTVQGSVVRVELSAQANVGRWVLGQRRPKLPPPTTLEIEHVAVVSGVTSRYTGSSSPRSSTS